jgi:hypothetical protein
MHQQTPRHLAPCERLAATQRPRTRAQPLGTARLAELRQVMHARSQPRPSIRDGQFNVGSSAPATGFAPLALNMGQTGKIRVLAQLRGQSG